MKKVFSLDHSRWCELRDRYDSIVAAHGKTEFVDMDRWYRKDLPLLIQQRNPRHITKAELVKLVQWKLMRGKWRPKLLDYAKEQPDSLVTSETEKGLQLLQANPGNPSSALAPITKLKGVGPATASAILAAASPDYPYMGDEALAAVGNKSDYTVNAYQALFKQLTGAAEQLTQQGPDNPWTPKQVEECLYVNHLEQLPQKKSDQQKKSGTGKPASPAGKSKQAAAPSTTPNKRRKKT